MYSSHVGPSHPQHLGNQSGDREKVGGTQSKVGLRPGESRMVFCHSLGFSALGPTLWLPISDMNYEFLQWTCHRGYWITPAKVSERKYKCSNVKGRDEKWFKSDIGQKKQVISLLLQTWPSRWVWNPSWEKGNRCVQDASGWKKDFKLPTSWAVVLSGSFKKDIHAYFLK